MTWLALHLPALPLEIHTRGLEAQRWPLAVIRPGRERRVLLCNAAAAAAGVVPGQPVAAALALVAGLQLLPRRPEREREALEGVARWAGRFSSLVSLVAPDSLVLEAGRSLRLFGGARGLGDAVAEGLGGLGYRVCQCQAPTPEAALLGARRGLGPLLPDWEAARAALGSLPLAALALGREQQQTLAHAGLRTLDELLNLPRAGLARRCGPALVDYLERLSGERPDPRAAWVPPARYSGRLELSREVEEAGALLFAARRLLVELGGFLWGRGAATRRLEWTLVHADGESTRLGLGLALPTRDPGRLTELLRERLERLVLPRPVREIRLRVAEVEVLAGESLGLFPDHPQHREEAAGELLERLQARLGREAVTGLEQVADHRPERAWRRLPPGEARDGEVPGNVRRPLWLLEQPRPLEQRAGWPWLDGQRLALGRERERIESGWWDGAAVARDYFVATTPAGQRLWVFRELVGERRWFLHGWFA